MARFAVGLSLVSLFLCAFSLAQSDPAAGVLPFSTQIGGPIDSIDLATSNISLQIPVRSKAGKIPFNYRLAGNSHAYLYWLSDRRYLGVSTGILGQPFSADLGATVASSLSSYKCNNYLNTSMWTYSAVVDATGASHPLTTPYPQLDTTGCTPTQFTDTVSDGSGYTLQGSISGSTITLLVYDSSGNQMNLNTETMTDPDGVTMKAPLGGSNTYTDTLNTMPLTVSITRGVGGASDTYVYKDASRNNQTVTVSYTSYTQQTEFGCEDLGPTPVYLPTTITLPTGGSYTISYEPTSPGSNNKTGRIAEITLPSGGTITYGYSGGTNGFDCNSGVVPTLTRKVTDNNGNGGTWQYVNSNDSDTPGNFTVTETDPANNQTVHNFSGEYQTQVAYYQGSATGTPLKTVLTCYNGNTTNCASPSSVPTSPITQTDVYTSLGTSSSNHVQTGYDSYGNTTGVTVWDFGGSTILSQQFFYYGQSYAGNYVCNSYPSNVYIHNTPCFSFVTGASQTNISYSNGGHPTSISRWVSGSNWLTSYPTYGTNGASAGVLSAIQDANGAVTNFGNFQCNGMLAGSTTYPISAVGSDSQTWDCIGGVKTQYTDVNGQATNYSYTANVADPLYRLKSVTDPDGGVVSYTYNTGSTLPWTITTSTSIGPGQPAISSTSVIDGLGRSVMASGSVYSTSTDPNNTSSGTRYDGGAVYNNLGQIVQSFSPYFTTSDPTYGYTGYAYDGISRTTLITSPSGLQTQYIYTNRATEEVRFPGNNAFKKVYQTDGLGRVVDICEVTTVTQANNVAPSTCNLDIAPKGFLSSLSYDPLGNLLTMSRDITAQTRTMTYDGLSRLLSVTTPESGTTTYSYSPTTGDLSTVVYPLPNAASGTETVTYSFDTMHRLSCKSYSDGTTPGLCITYDQANVPSAWGSTALSNGKGRVSWLNATNFTGVDTVFGYDPMGRVSTYGQCAPTGCNNGTRFVATYTYDYAGDVQNGNNILNTFNWTNTYNSIGQLKQVYTTELTPTSAGDLVSGIAYNALGEQSSDLLGNGEQEGWGYSKDGVATNYSVGSGPTFDWNLTVNTGVISASNDNQYTGMNYAYDDFGRLASMTGANGQGWGFTYGYDQYGNRWNQTVTQGSGPQPSYSFSSTSSPNTNHIVCCGITYDDAGNVIYDGTYYYTYDGNNRVIKVGTSSGGDNVASYAYNSRGMRVSTTVSGLGIEWMYDLSGRALTATEPGTNQYYQAEYFVGPRDWGTLTSVGVNFRYPDWVGNGRVWKDVAGTITQKAAFAAFGDGLFAPSGGTCCSFQAGMFDSAWYDAANDTYHTLNREYSPTQGRWLTPDPAGLAAADPTNPQSWNRYAYVLNNPVSFVDPLGLDCATANGDGSVTTASGDCDAAANNQFYFDGTINPNTAFVDANGDVVAQVNGSNSWTCSGDCNNDSFTFYSQGLAALPNNNLASVSSNNAGGVTPVPAANNGNNFSWWGAFGKSLFSWKNFSAGFKSGGCFAQFAEEAFDPADAMGLQDQAIKATAQSGAYVAATAYAANQGLIVPMRSSIVRGILDFGETLGESAALGATVYSEGKALVNEVKSFQSGECQ